MRRKDGPTHRLRSTPTAARTPASGNSSPTACRNTSSLTVSHNIARWKNLATRIEPALLAESARWGDAYRPDEPYRPDPDWARVNNWQCNTFFPSNHFIALKRFKDANLAKSGSERG